MPSILILSSGTIFDAWRAAQQPPALRRDIIAEAIFIINFPRGEIKQQAAMNVECKRITDKQRFSQLLDGEKTSALPYRAHIYRSDAIFDMLSVPSISIISRLA